MPHASQTGNRNRGPYSYSHRIAQDTQRPYVRQSVTDRLLGQPQAHAVHTLYANRTQQLRSDFVYPETAYYADAEYAALALSSAESPGQPETPYPRADSVLKTDAPVVPGADIDNTTHQQMIGSSLSENPGSRSPISSSYKPGNEFAAEAGSHTRRADEPGMPLIDWLEQVQARVPLHLEDEQGEPRSQSADTYPELNTNIKIPGDGSGSEPSLNANPAALHPRPVVQQRQTVKPETHTRTTDIKTAEPIFTSDSNRDKQVSRQVDMNQSAVNIELPGSASPASVRKTLSPVRSSRSPATDTLEQKFPSASDVAPEPSTAAGPMPQHNSAHTGIDNVAATRRLSAVVSNARVDPAQSTSAQTQSATASMPAPNKPRATQLARLQQALQTQNMLIQAQSNSTEQPAPSQPAAAAPVNNTSQQAPRTVIVQRILSAPGMDYAYFERSYSCRLGARGYR